MPRRVWLSRRDLAERLSRREVRVEDAMHGDVVVGALDGHREGRAHRPRSAPLGAVSMATFALVTGIALEGVAQLSRLVTLGAQGRRALGVALLAGALLMVLRPIPTLAAGSGAPACHAHAHEEP